MNPEELDMTNANTPETGRKNSWLVVTRKTLVTIWAIALFLLVPVFFLSYQSSFFAKVAAAWHLEESSPRPAQPTSTTQSPTTEPKQDSVQPTPSSPVKTESSQ